MRHSFLSTAYFAGLAASHGHDQNYTINGTTHPSLDPQHDYDVKLNAKCIEWNSSKAKGYVRPVEIFALPNITCRFHPLRNRVWRVWRRVGSEIEFKWFDWFGNHKGLLVIDSILHNALNDHYL
jgi:hypothetical protein